MSDLGRVWQTLHQNPRVTAVALWGAAILAAIVTILIVASPDPFTCSQRHALPTGTVGPGSYCFVLPPKTPLTLRPNGQALDFKSDVEPLLVEIFDGRTFPRRTFTLQPQDCMSPGLELPKRTPWGSAEPPGYSHIVVRAAKETRVVVRVRRWDQSHAFCVFQGVI